MKVGSYKIKTKKIILVGIAISAVIIIISIMVSGLQDAYTQSIVSYRKEKNDYFKTDKNSPIEDQVGFKELLYFAPNKTYSITPTIDLIKDSSFVTIVNNDGEKNKYWRFAKAIFELNDQKDTLVIYRNASLSKDAPGYFLPFYDQTNGEETYSGGRYLDLEIGDSTSFVLDFNFAYNPYCVYNYRFSCPIPPAENKLNTRIEVGERMFVK